MLSFTTDALHTRGTAALAATEKLLAEQLSVTEKVQAQLREQTEAAMQHSLAATRIGIDAMLASQKALLSAFAPAASDK